MVFIFLGLAAGFVAAVEDESCKECQQKKLPKMQRTLDKEKVSANIDKTQQLNWLTSFKNVKAEAIKENKPIFFIHMLGDLMDVT